MPLHEISLPQEVVDEIIDIVGRRSCPLWQSDLIACSLTSRSLRSRTLRYLFRRLDTGTPRFQRIGEWRRFAAIVSQSPQVAASYTSLALLSATLECIFSSLVNITHLTVIGPTAGLIKYSIPRYLASMPITSVILNGTTFDTLLDFVDFFGGGLPVIDSLTLVSVSLARSTTVSRANIAPSPCTIHKIRLSLVEPAIFEAVVDGLVGRLDLHTIFFKGIPHPSMFLKLFSGMPLRELTLVIEPWSSEIPPLACCLPHFELLHIDIAKLEWASSAINAGHIGGSLRTLTLSATDTTVSADDDIRNLNSFNGVLSGNIRQFPQLKELEVECYDYYHRALEVPIRRNLNVLPIKWRLLSIHFYSR
ncbi:hypothetical protein CPB85DRAFT_1342790 [Mucidula mucida]|nr:hypothetical protein CPB85DRAFT_1342790 [Mucidula mucida]